MRPIGTFVLCAAVGALTAGCEAGSRDPHLVDVSTTDYAIHAPDTVPAGALTFRMRAGGSELHHVQIVRFDEGRSFTDFAAAVQQPGAPPSWVRMLGGPNGADPGDSSEVTVHLEPGSYGLICVIPDREGRPHIALGMMRPLTVTGRGTSLPRPAADVDLMMVDNDFQLSAPIAAGRRTILVENGVDQPHEVVIVRLAEGRTAQDVVAWVLAGMPGPPPASGVGGTAALDRGEWNLVHVEFTPGSYALLDFVPSRGDGRPNAAHGMVRQIEVQ